MRIWDDFVSRGRKEERERVRDLIRTKLGERNWLPSSIDSLLSETKLNEEIRVATWYQSFCPICDSSVGAAGDPGRRIHQACLVDLNDQMRDIFGEVYHNQFEDGTALRARLREEFERIAYEVIQSLERASNP